MTDLPMDSSSVYVRIPQPKTNMNWYDFVKATPTWAKKLEKEMGIGRTQVKKMETNIARSKQQCATE